MPRVSKHQTALNRASITEIAGRLLRERGIAGTSVADLMGAAGLTHGGFYGHFESKDVLAAAACSSAFAASVRRWKSRVADAASAGVGCAAAARSAIVEGFLSLNSRNKPGQACPTAALAGDVARESPDAPVRAAFAAGMEELLLILQGLEREGAPADDRKAALADLATLVGAQILARATSQSVLSSEILAAARARLLHEKSSS
jgi:TetR/AcrR family transcriptional regulator, transcriptional repressor for nem operon